MNYHENNAILKGNLLILNFAPLVGMRFRYDGYTFRVTEFDEDFIVANRCELAYHHHEGTQMIQGAYMVKI